MKRCASKKEQPVGAGKTNVTPRTERKVQRLVKFCRCVFQGGGRSRQGNIYLKFDE